MHLVAPARALLAFGAATLAVWLGAGRAASQNPDLKPYSGKATLAAGFGAPHRVKVAGGAADEAAIRTDLGGVKAWVSDAPDFKLHYTAGSQPLTFQVLAKGDTTLLINGPGGKWFADDDGGKGTNPRVTFANPKSGRYDVWVGSYKKQIERGTLVISEKK